MRILFCGLLFRFQHPKGYLFPLDDFPGVREVHYHESRQAIATKRLDGGSPYFRVATYVQAEGHHD